MAAFVGQLAAPQTTGSWLRSSTISKKPALVRRVRPARLTMTAAPSWTSTPGMAQEPAESPIMPRIRTDKKVVLITGSSSGIGLEAAKLLAKTGDYFVVMANRNFAKAEVAAKTARMKSDSYVVMHLDLASMDSVRQFARMFDATGLSLNCIVCNAATWKPKDKVPALTADGFEEAVGTNHLGHFLLANLLLPKLTGSQPRVVFIGTETHNPDSIAGKIPPQANLGDLSGLENALQDGSFSMIDGKGYEPTKAYKDSKVCNAITMKEFHRRYNRSRGISFCALFPGCIAESPLFREKRGWFRTIFPAFQKYVTKQYVSVEEAGRRLKSVVSEPEFYVSGAYWKWNGQKAESTPSVNSVSRVASNEEIGKQLWDLSCKLVKIETPVQ
eukprot:CAMPEP_0198311838 /NCGR_PEP_ID=MMETSP1450-20131203/3446_1 /TAXON_ID=753684 ORGANISM="Madagascaria erythrocladiodes, Strain CCMP3234" /NCGR_SAMPLE_ID=MMETSP1450 /ASSEMBLY_ACC=CAM_ASM_001115 /LENGTH=385 /DNA_ID=CAMNT_0044014753 /DNA_START=23 /DNA_END=1180 /DNA_ORIENTATION=-